MQTNELSDYFYSLFILCSLLVFLFLFKIWLFKFNCLFILFLLILICFLLFCSFPHNIYFPWVFLCCFVLFCLLIEKKTTRNTSKGCLSNFWLHFIILPLLFTFQRPQLVVCCSWNQCEGWAIGSLLYIESQKNTFFFF